MNGYLIPENSKRGTLTFNIFRHIDLWILLGDIGLLLLLLAIVPTTDLIAVTIALLSICICGLLAVPVPNYYNVLGVLGGICRFCTEKKKICLERVVFL